MPETIKLEWPVQSSSQQTVNMQQRQHWWCMCCWYQADQYLVSKQHLKWITGTMICSKSTSYALALPKQDNTNGTCAADMEQTIISLANNAVNEIN